MEFFDKATTVNDIKATVPEQAKIDDIEVFNKFYEEVNTYLEPCEINQINVFSAMYAKHHKNKKDFKKAKVLDDDNKVIKAVRLYMGIKDSEDDNRPNQISKINPDLDWTGETSNIEPPMTAIDHVKKSQTKKFMSTIAKFAQKFDKKTEGNFPSQRNKNGLFLGNKMNDIKMVKSNRMSSNNNIKNNKQFLFNNSRQKSQEKPKSPRVQNKQNFEEIQNYNEKKTKCLYLNEPNTDNTPKIIKNQINNSRNLIPAQNTSSYNPEKPFLMVFFLNKLVFRIFQYVFF